MTLPEDTAALPLYLQIADRLRTDIEGEVYAAGDRLPTETQLSNRFSVNRHTLRRAIGLLKDEGLLRVDRGRGTFVVASPIRYAIGKRVRFSETLRAVGLNPSYKLLRAVEIPADRSVAQQLQLETGTIVVAIERLGLANNNPLSVVSSYFPQCRFPDLCDQASTMTSISKLLWDEYQCDHLRRSTAVTARTVQAADARYLGVPLNHPILLVESVNVDRNDNPIEYGVARLRGDSVELVFENELSD